MFQTFTFYNYSNFTAYKNLNTFFSNNHHYLPYEDPVRKTKSNNIKKHIKSSNLSITDFVKSVDETKSNADTQANVDKRDRNSLFFSPTYTKKMSPNRVSVHNSRRKLLLDQIKITHYADIKVTSSGRVTLQQQEILMQKQLSECIRCQLDDGLVATNFEDKGRGVTTTRCFEEDEFVIEYRGELISRQEALLREKIYDSDPNKFGSYMFFFEHESKAYCIDATKESKELGRLVNHSKTQSNLRVKLISVEGVPRLVFIAKRLIKKGEELLYDYNDRRKSILKANPWLNF